MTRRCRAAASIAAFLLPAFATPAAAQRPAELTGRVVDAAAGAPLEGARVELMDAARVAATDASGAFVLRGIDSGVHALHIERFGYADTTVSVTVARGITTVLRVALRPLPAVMPALLVSGEAATGSVRIGRAAIERSGARTAGDVIAGVAGVVVRRTGAGGAETVSVRGSDPSAVLVVVDGIPINDPVTGVADLSGVAATSIETVEVLPGARSSRWGPRAEAGVIVVRTRRTTAPFAAELAAGSLGGRGVRVEASGTAPFAWQAGAGWRTLDGAFGFTLPVEAGGGEARRANADAEQADLFAAVRTALAGGELRIRASGELLGRGLPGKSFAPSPRAREVARRARVVTHWERVRSNGRLDMRLSASAQRVRFHDAAPPIGFAYDDTTDASVLEAAAGAGRQLFGERVRLGAGAESRWQHIASTRLRAGALPHRWDAGLFGHADADVPALGGTAGLSVGARADRDPSRGRAVASHSVAVRWTRGGSTLELAHRSSFSPPALDDQFFRDAVGVEPNPHLRAQRVPSEVALDIAHARPFGSMTARAAAAAYTGAVRDMIVWAPDYRFVWSPRNVDVRRRGVEASLGIDAAGLLRTLRASYGYARIVYADGSDDAQLEYRPRSTAQLSAGWALADWDAGLHARYVGERYPAAARVNALPGFWTVSADLNRTWRTGVWSIRTALHLDRLFDAHDALIFGFPEPGRVGELRVRLSRTNTPGDNRP